MSALAKTKMQLVEVHGDRLTTTSLVIAEAFGRTHKNVLRSVRSLRDDGTIGRLEFEPPSYVNQQGKEQPLYILSERAFLVAMPFIGGKKSRQGQVRLVDEFFRQRQVITNLTQQRNDPNWRKAKLDGKAVYHQKTDVIKQFIEYAKAQGSKSAEKYYTTLATMENKALFFLDQKFDNCREMLNVKQLMQIATADDVIEKALQDGMERKLFYKDIFQLTRFC